MINSYFAVHSNDKLIIFRTNIVLDRESKDKYRFSAIPLTEEGETIKVREDYIFWKCHKVRCKISKSFLMLSFLLYVCATNGEIGLAERFFKIYNFRILMNLK